MIPSDFTQKGCLLMVTIEELITYLAKDHPLKDFEILVVSKDIITENRANRTTSEYGNIVEESKYDNIDFLPNLNPNTNVLGILYSDGFSGRNGEVFEQFSEAYEQQLSDDGIFVDLICIVGMVVNDHIPTIVLCAPLDKKVGFPGVLMSYIQDMFGIKTYEIDDVIDPDVDVTDIGDREAVKAAVDEYRKQYSEVNEADGFFNHLIDSVRGKYKELLQKKSQAQLIEIAMNVGAVLRRKDTKEQMIDRIIDAKIKKKG